MENLQPELLARAAPVFHAAIELPAERRAAFLDEKCLDDSALRAVVDRLLTHAAETQDFFSQTETIPRSELNSPLTAPTTFAVGARIGRYELLRSLGRGGMGQVLLARQENPQREVALKILRADLTNPTLNRRFRLEAEILGRLNHPGISQIYEAGTTEDGHSYFAMEYVPGLPLGQFVRDEGLGPREILELAIQICEAVQHAHEHGVIHRDLKPSNIMAVRQDDGSIRTWVLDFGVAMASGLVGPLATLYTIPGQLVGTLAYMSPEQVSDFSDDLDVRSDVYQLGVIVYEMLSGRLPLDVESVGYVQAMRRIAEDTPAHLGSVDVIFRGDIETIINKAMAKEREERYGSAGELAADFRRYLDGEPVQARPATAFYRLGKVLRKRRRSVLGFAAVGVILAATAWLIVANRPLITFSAPILTRLTSPAEKPFSYSSLSLSPDGNQLAYSYGGLARVRDMVTGKSRIVPLSGTPEERRVITASWHPAGDVMFLESKVDQDHYQLTRYTMADQSEETILSYAEPAHPVVSPDGKLIVLELGHDHELVVLDLASGEMDTVLQVGEETTIACPTWGPDSRHLAYIRIREPSLSLECISLTGDRHVLLQDKRLGFYAQRSTLAWLPDGRLLYSLYRDMSRTGVDLLALPMDTQAGKAAGDPVHLCAVEERAVLNLTYSPATNTLAFGGHRKARKLVIFDLGENAPLEYRELATRGWPCLPVGWLSDGQSLVLEETNSTRDYETLVMNVVTGDLKALSCCPENGRPLGLTPDGRHVVVLDGVKLVAVPVDCGPVIDLDFEMVDSPYRIDVQSPRDGVGNACLFVLEGSKISIREISLTNGIGPVIKRISFDFANIFAQRNTWALLAPDGMQLATAEFDSNIALYDMFSDESAEIATGLGLIQELRWSWDGTRIYCQGAYGDHYPRWMVRLDPKTGESEVLWTSDGFESIVRPMPSPNDDYLVSQTLTLGVDFFILEGL